MYSLLLLASDKFLSMPLEEKRNLYKDSTYYTCDKIETWQDYFLKAKERLQKQCKLFLHCIMKYLKLLYFLYKEFVFVVIKHEMIHMCLHINSVKHTEF